MEKNHASRAKHLLHLHHWHIHLCHLRAVLTSLQHHALHIAKGHPGNGRHRDASRTTQASVLDDPDAFDFDEEPNDHYDYGSLLHCNDDTGNGIFMDTLNDDKPIFDTSITDHAQVPKFTNTASDGCILIEGINVSHLPNHWQFLHAREAVFMGIGEHSTTPADMAM